MIGGYSATCIRELPLAKDEYNEIMMGEKVQATKKYKSNGEN